MQKEAVEMYCCTIITIKSHHMCKVFGGPDKTGRQAHCGMRTLVCLPLAYATVKIVI